MDNHELMIRQLYGRVCPDCHKPYEFEKISDDKYKYINHHHLKCDTAKKILSLMNSVHAGQTPLSRFQTQLQLLGL